MTLLTAFQFASVATVCGFVCLLAAWGFHGAFLAKVAEEQVDRWPS